MHYRRPVSGVGYRSIAVPMLIPLLLSIPRVGIVSKVGTGCQLVVLSPLPG